MSNEVWKLTLGLASPYFWHREHCLSSSLDHPVSRSAFESRPRLPVWTKTTRRESSAKTHEEETVPDPDPRTIGVQTSPPAPRRYL